MKIWLDDERPMPLGFDRHVTTSGEAISLLAAGGITLISLDHDLGNDSGTGYDVACFIEQAAFSGTLEQLEVYIHTANPVGRANMEKAINNAMRFWDIGKR